MASEPRCGKPGCSALKIVGKPCTDADCPQQWVHHTATRPAPAATDTGLETAIRTGHPPIEYVIRSQAEELLAERDEIINRHREAQVILGKQLNEVIAHNAAKDARIKELENIKENYEEANDRMTGAYEAIEAKLAAATETAAQAAYRACAETRHVTLGEKAADAVRAVLGGKP